MTDDKKQPPKDADQEAVNKKEEITKLKAMAYDRIATMNAMQDELNQINLKIKELTQ